MKINKLTKTNNIRISIKGHYDNPNSKLKDRFYIPEKYVGKIIEYIGTISLTHTRT